MACRLAVSRSLGDSQFKGKGGQPRGSEAPPNTQGQLVSPEPSVKSVRLGPSDRVVIVASGKWGRFQYSDDDAALCGLALHVA